MNAKLFETEETQEVQKEKSIHGYPVDELISGIQKEIRRGEEYKATFIAVEMLESGLDYILWRRLKVIAAEDVDNPLSVSMAMQNEWAFYKIGKSNDFGKMIAVKTVINLCREPKDRTADDIYNYVKEDMKDGKMMEISDYCKDMHTKTGRKKGRGLSHFWHVGAVLINESPNYVKKYLEFFRKKYPYKGE